MPINAALKKFVFGHLSEDLLNQAESLNILLIIATIGHANLGIHE